MPYNLLTHLMLGCSWVWLLGKCKEQTSKRGKRWVTGSCKSTLHITSYIHGVLLYLYEFIITYIYIIISYIISFISHLSVISPVISPSFSSFHCHVPDQQLADRSEALAARNSAPNCCGVCFEAPGRRWTTVTEARPPIGPAETSKHRNISELGKGHGKTLQY